MIPSSKLLLASVCLVAFALPASGQSMNTQCVSEDWPQKPDEVFAADCADMAFNGNLEDRQALAWMFFARVNQMIPDPANGGMSGTGMVPVWMAWPTDPDTFGSRKPFYQN
jgi:hypothetical protein